MNPRAPHYKFNTSAPSGSNGTRNGSEFASVFGSLRTSFVPASVPTMNGTCENPTLTCGTPTQTSTQSPSLFKFEPRMSSDKELLERARVEQQEQSQLLLHSKLLRLNEQVDELMSQRAAFEEKQIESNDTIGQLRGDIVHLQAHTRSQNDKLEILKGLSDEHAREHKALAQRLKEMPGHLDARLQHTVTRIDRVEKLVHSVELQTSNQVKQHATQLRIPKGGDSSADDMERLVIQMDEVRSKIGEMQQEFNIQAEMRRFMDECAEANKVRLEMMFYQLTKELMGKCDPEDIDFGMSEQRTFILRQHVLERLTIANAAQLEFERLRQSQLMPR
ncbi:hypothetical protein E4T39_03119 [Aureobasidium subglaciale]|nr:hypothetical protein E4T39_03119 [Aureobasidium subglaciale]